MNSFAPSDDDQDICRHCGQSSLIHEHNGQCPPKSDAPYSCYDCGSLVEDHHTPACEMAPRNAVRDLPETPGTQWWDYREGTRQPSPALEEAAARKRVLRPDRAGGRFSSEQSALGGKREHER